MKYTSAEANKLLKGLEGKVNDIRRKEDLASSFIAASGEDVESLRPEYDYTAVQKELAKLEGQIRTVKHAINTFNLTHELPGFDGLTIDQALVYIPQLTARITKLRTMSAALPKKRVESYNTNIVDYTIANYDIDEADKDYTSAKTLLASLQLALDAVNTTEKMEINIESD